MLPYSLPLVRTLTSPSGDIASFMSGAESNLDADTVASFGEEWSTFDAFSEVELKRAGDQYFDIVTGVMLNPRTVVLDLGCGTGRWSKYIGARAAFIEAIDPSVAVYAAKRFTGSMPNIRVTQASCDNIPFADESFDLVMSLGVLHHIPDTREALRAAVRKAKRGGHVLLYLYYALDNRSRAFRALFRAADVVRRGVSSLPPAPKRLVCDLLAVSAYMPFVALSRAIEHVRPGSAFAQRVPLSYYADKPFKIIRNDALDRFGTPLEQRFSRAQIEEMMRDAGLGDIHFSENAPYWHVVGRKL